MAERINLEVPATSSALPIVHMVLGGIGARLDLSLEQLDDLSLAADSVLTCALKEENATRFAVSFVVADEDLTVSFGRFESVALRTGVGQTAGDCIDLCVLLRRLVDGVEVREMEGGAYSVVLHVVVASDGR